MIAVLIGACLNNLRGKKDIESSAILPKLIFTAACMMTIGTIMVSLLFIFYSELDPMPYHKLSAQSVVPQIVQMIFFVFCLIFELIVGMYFP